MLTILQTRPNFLILDEPTNDLDLITIGVLEDFLMRYKGCLIVISHDRFFMDKITDHLFIFEGEGVVKDFWGTYSEYKEEGTRSVGQGTRNKGQEYRSEEQGTKGEEDSSKTGENIKKLSYMEKRELDQLTKDILSLEKERDEISRLFDQKDIPYDDIKTLSSAL